MKLTLLFICLMVNCSEALACDSYESCVESKTEKTDAGWVIEREANIEELLRGIAYKLDEISKKLNTQKK